MPRNRFQVSSAIVKWIVDGRRYLARIQLYSRLSVFNLVCWYINSTKWLEKFERSLLAYRPCQPALRMIITEGMDAIYLKLDGIEGES